MAKSKHKSIIRQGQHADTSCAVCGRPLTLWDDVKQVDGVTVCASGCLGDGILRMRRHNGEDDSEERCGSWFEEDYGGTVDGLGNVSSDADPGL